ncbi:MAG: DUF4157 domain-containing protein, partial [Kofleriaceae bacterium]
MTDVGRTTARTELASTSARSPSGRESATSNAGIGNLAVARSMRSGARGAEHAGSPLGNQEQQGRQPIRCGACEAKVRRYGVQAKCAECQPRVQPQSTDSANKSLDSVRSVLEGGSQQLPHRDRIQASFGRHDLSAVRTLTGGAAREANDRIGAQAFTSGHRIAFRDAPDERLVAHESAHVIQQREGASAP